jgi:hypothetical protein
VEKTGIVDETANLKLAAKRIIWEWELLIQVKLVLLRLYFGYKDNYNSTTQKKRN